MARIGQRNQLTAVKETPQGLWLDAAELGEILLPSDEVPPGQGVGSCLSVFLYWDKEGELVATTQMPTAMVGEFACLEVVGINRRVGAFLDWGLSKDLLLPFREQKEKALEGDRVIVYVFLDEQNDRIVASSRLNRFLDRTEPRYWPKQEVDLLISDETPLGYNAIVENAHRGLLYHSELSEPLQYGQRIRGFVKQVRPDGKIDLRRDPAGYGRVEPLSELILQALNENKGTLPYNDKTPPEIIRKVFGVSKKAFKQALGTLYKQRRIVFDEAGIRLADKA